MNNLTLNKKWQEYSDDYLKLTIREQYLILLTGLVAAFFIGRVFQQAVSMF